MTIYIGASFSVSMIPKGKSAYVEEIGEERFKEALEKPFVSVVAHEATAKLLSQKFNKEIAFNRKNIVLEETDLLYVAVPQLRFEITREFTYEEVREAPFRYFLVRLLGASKEL